MKPTSVALEPLNPDCPEDKGQTEPLKNILEENKGVERPKKLAQILRWLGALLLGAATLSFILQEWAGMDSLYRYLSFLGFTAGLSVVGFYLGVGLKDDKGARTMLGLPLVFLAAHFAQLGAIVYASTQGVNQHFSHLFRFEAPPLPITIATLFGAVLVLTPVVFVGYASFVRSKKLAFTGQALLLSAVLLLPVRAPGIIALLALAMLAASLGFAMKMGNGSTMRTWEGRAAKLTLYLPVVVLLGRQVLLYPLSGYILSVVFLTLAFGAASLPRSVEKLSAYTRPIHYLSTFFASLAWLSFVDAIFFSRYYGLFGAAVSSVTAPFALPLTILPIALIVAGQSFFFGTTEDGRLAGHTERKLAALWAMGSMLVQLMWYEGVFSSILCVTVALLVIVSAFSMEERGLLRIGVFGFSIGLLYHLKYAGELYTLSPWASLAGLGVLVVFLSSYIERKHPEIRRRWQVFQAKIQDWQ